MNSANGIHGIISMEDKVLYVFKVSFQLALYQQHYQTELKYTCLDATWSLKTETKKYVPLISQCPYNMFLKFPK